MRPEGEERNLNSNLRAIVDIGSNGIRFSITSLDPNQARIIPCLFQDRAAISLFDAQHSSPVESNTNSADPTPTVSPSAGPCSDKNDISTHVIRDVCQALVRFRTICRDFGVPDHHVYVIATEATREAPNSADFQNAIQKATGWEVRLLSKEDEGRTGAYGVASSFFEVQGLFMDLGGGSTQVSWITCKDGEFKMSDTPVSLPYGAAALSRRLTKESRESVLAEMTAQLTRAVEHINIPEELKQVAQGTGGYKIYVSGGGFRGLGHLILAKQHGSFYPLPIINGFSCSKEDITSLIESDILTSGGQQLVTKKSFRISERRANQLPAVALLVTAVMNAFPPIRKVMFSQGGVREGALFHDLPPSVRCQDPLYVATRPYAPLLAPKYAEVLLKGIPDNAPKVIKERLPYSIVNVAFVHSSYPKELQPSSALAIAATGIISGAHGLSHEVRALLGLALCHRWGGELPSREFKDSLISIVNPKKLAWWACYCGHLMHVIGGVYPGGNVRENLIDLSISNANDSGFDLNIQANKNDVLTSAPTVRVRINNLEKKLKKLYKDFGKEHGLKVNVNVKWV
ncbi:hypothetical protein TRICI_001405 [Trichomonascus ciferrii]|uniref:Uncharacterized protein n=1 Tax=Trichomonascus ciferrii TaxID=44093 RepID=A0A642V9I7_9ASCO|nr:hypothetical protein TRICI_001405 [Trichomonascus ciferrii]